MPPPRNRRPVRAAPQPNGFWPIDAKLLIQIGGSTEGLAVCTTCAALILASDKSMNLHREHHR